MNPEDALIMQKDVDVQNIKSLSAPSHSTPIAPAQVNTRQEETAQNEVIKTLAPLENAITPHIPAKVNDSENFYLMHLLAEVEKEEIPDEELVLATTQCEQDSVPVNDPFTPAMTTTTTIMKKCKIHHSLLPTVTLEVLEPLIFTFTSIKINKNVKVKERGHNHKLTWHAKRNMAPSNISIHI